MSISWDQLLATARKELGEKTLCNIHEATSYQWAARALAAYDNALTSGNAVREAHWLRDGDDYAHEAAEHAALAGVLGSQTSVLTDVLTKLARAKKRVTT